MTGHYTESEARALFEERMRIAREMLDALPREAGLAVPPEKRFQVERSIRLRVEEFIAQQPTFEEFIANIRERIK